MPPSTIFQNTNSPLPVNTQLAPPPVPPSPNQPGQPQTPVQPPSSDSVVNKPKKKFPKALLIAGGALLFILIIFAVVKLVLSNRGQTSGEITWWGLWEEQSTVGPLISAYEQAHPDVKINYVSQSHQDYRERLSNALAKGEGPDIFSFHNSWVPMFKSDLDALPSSVMTAADYSTSFYPVIVSDLSYGNSIVGIPIGYDALALYINQDIFEAAGKNAPSTWDELRKTAKELTIKDESGNILQSGVALGRTENVDNWQDILALLMIQNGVDLRNPVGKNAEDALTFFTLFSTVDKVWDTTLPTSTQAFESGKLAMYIAPSWRAFEIKEKNPDLRFITVPVPQLPKDSPSESDITYATYWAQGVWNKSPSKAAAWDFLAYITSEDSLQKLYQNESSTRAFGEPYPRVAMANLLADHPLVGSIIKQAPGARSWYLASRTFDGATGINSQMSNYFGDAINALVNREMKVGEALDVVAQGVAQVMAQYGISVR